MCCEDCVYYEEPWNGNRATCEFHDLVIYQPDSISPDWTHVSITTDTRIRSVKEV